MSVALAPNAARSELRTELAAECTANLGANWEASSAPGSYRCHELLDRIATVNDLLERLVVRNPALVQNPGWFAKAEQALDLLGDLYQEVGAEHLPAAGQD